MSKFSYDIEPEGLDEVIEVLNRYPEISHQELMKAMQKSVFQLEAAIKPETPVDRGRLRSAIGSEIQEVSTLSIVGRVGPAMEREIYPQVMELGGVWEHKMPPSRALEPWVKRVIRPENQDDIPRIAFLIARSIKRKGIEGRRYLQKGFEKSKDRIDEFFVKAVEVIMERMTKE